MTLKENIEFKRIGVIRTPYGDNAPYQPVDDDEGEFRIVLEDKYSDGLGVSPMNIEFL